MTAIVTLLSPGETVEIVRCVATIEIREGQIRMESSDGKFLRDYFARKVLSVQLVHEG